VSRADRRRRFAAAEAKRLGPKDASAIAGPGENTVRRPKRFVKKAERDNMSRGDLLHLLEEIADQPDADVAVTPCLARAGNSAFAWTVLAAFIGSGAALIVAVALEIYLF
jgi:hypothetical protein